MTKHKNRRIILLALVAIMVLSIPFAYVYRHKIRFYAVSAYYYVKDYRHNAGYHQNSPTDISVPFKYTVYGIDVSRYQEKVDWRKVTEVKINGNPIRFAFVKASEGSRWRDPYYKRNYRKARKEGFIVGAYHYYQPQVHSDEQLKNFTSMVDLQRGDFAPVLDVEEIQDMPKDRFQLGVLTLLQKLEKHYGIKPILYTNQDYYFKFFSGSKYAEYPIWIAYFSTRKPGLSESKWYFWQFSDKGRMAGIHERVDLNVFKGKEEDLNQFRIK